MRWCTENRICRYLSRHTRAVVFLLVFLLCANQVIYFRNSAVFFHNSSIFNSNSCVRENTNNYDKEIFSNIQWDKARLDDGRMLKIYDWVWMGSLWTNLTNDFNVCLATQGSIDRISWIGEVSEKWQGPISLAVYVRNGQEFGVLSLFISYIKKCSISFAQTVSIHLAFPINFNDTFEIVNDEEFHPCDQPHIFMEKLLSKMLNRNVGGIFPQNHMRNIARKNCPTPWVFMTDVDIIPQLNSASLLNTFYNSPETKCKKCAFVIPVFELEESQPFPNSKKELVSYVKKGKARQFHLTIYENGHAATNYSVWTSTNLEEEAIKVSHHVDGEIMDHYEPFYISSDEIPKHDERFVGYGFTRSSQVLEAKATGWEFYVLTPIFAIHWGLQTRQGINFPSIPLPMRYKAHGVQLGKNVRYFQNLKNSVIYNDFVSELVAKYNLSMSRKNAQKPRGHKGVKIGGIKSSQNIKQTLEKTKKAKLRKTIANKITIKDSEIDVNEFL